MISTIKNPCASRTTRWRIKTGRQKSYNPARGCKPKRAWLNLPKTRSNIVDLVRNGTICAYRDLPEFDRDDLVQEIICYLAEKKWNSEMQDGRVVNIAKSFAATWAKDREVGSLRYRKSFQTTLLRYGLEVHPKTQWPDDCLSFEDEEEAQQLLNQAASGDALYSAFRQMRLRQEKHSCLRCASAKDLTIHHIVPQSVERINTIENTVVLCRTCHDEVEFVYDMIRLDEKLSKEQFRKIFCAWSNESSSEKFLASYFKEKE